MKVSKQHLKFSAVSLFVASALTAYIAHTPTRSGLAKQLAVHADSQSENTASNKSGDNLHRDIRKSASEKAPEPKNSTQPNMYLGVTMDSLDPVDVSIIREEVLLDIDFAQAMKAIDRDVFKLDESLLQKLFALPELMANMSEFEEIKSEYMRTNDFIRKKELIDKMKLSRKSAVGLIDSAISQEKRRNSVVPPVVPTEDR